MPLIVTEIWTIFKNFNQNLTDGRPDGKVSHYRWLTKILFCRSADLVLFFSYIKFLAGIPGWESWPTSQQFKLTNAKTHMGILELQQINYFYHVTSNGNLKKSVMLLRVMWKTKVVFKIFNCTYSNARCKGGKNPKLNCWVLWRHYAN